jgi:AbrB family looped-hinge helix DNA binding protein
VAATGVEAATHQGKHLLTTEDTSVSLFIPTPVDPLIRTLTVSEKGQVVLPADVRKLLGVQKGTRLVLVCDGERLLLQKETRAAAALEEDFSDLLAASAEALRDTWENEDDAVWDTV